MKNINNGGDKVTIRVSTNEDLNKTDAWIGLVGDSDIALETSHAAAGTSVKIPVYIFDDGSSVDSNILLEYRNISFNPKGVRTRILTPTSQPIPAESTQFSVEDGSMLNAGTKLITDPINSLQEEIWIRNISGNNLVVDRAKNGTNRLTIPSGTWVDAIPDHIYLSLTGEDDDFVNVPISLSDIKESWKPIKLYIRVSTGALKTQIKKDTYFRILADEFPRILF